MPLYSLTIKNSPLEELKTPIEVRGDYLTKFEVRFARGCYGLLGVSLYYGELQIIPENHGELLKGDDESVRWEGKIPLPEKKTKFTVYTKNEDDSYDHRALIRIHTAYAYELPEVDTVNQVRRSIAPIVQTFSKLFGR